MSSDKPEGITEHVQATDIEQGSDKKDSLDVKHNDEALRVLAAYDGEQTWTEAEEKKLLRKIDWKLMPVLCITYGLQYYDKAMLSQAVRAKRDSSTLT